MVAALVLGMANLAEPALWHDECYHLSVAENVAKTGRPVFLGGLPSGNAVLYQIVLGGVVFFFGNGETAVRMPSVIFAVLNVLLTFFLVRRLLGRVPALLAATLLAVSPWSVAYAREATFYALQQTCYLVFLWLVWMAMEEKRLPGAAALAVTALVAYVYGVLCSIHGVLFLVPVGLWTLVIFLGERRLRSRWLLLGVTVGVVGVLSMLFAIESMPRADVQNLVKEAGMGVALKDPVRADRLYYLRFFKDNLSSGFLLAALLGTGLMLVREGRRGLLAALAFWAPLLMLSFFVSYRRPRFVYFAFPFYLAACAYGTVWLARFLPGWRKAPWRIPVALVAALFLGRLSLSAIHLTADAVEVASGTHTTLARRHPQWRKPCFYVRERLTDDTAVLSTTYLPALYYIGRVDDWYPSTYLSWEYTETGKLGLKNPEALADFMAKHPKGYFLAESWRFNHKVFPQLAEDVAFVEVHMRRIEAGSSPDVTLYAWGMEEREAAP